MPASSATRTDGPQAGEEFELALALTTQWMLITGRRLGQHPLLHGLSPEELLEFWAETPDN
jgi:hypothetical protein